MTRDAGAKVLTFNPFQNLDLRQNHPQVAKADQQPVNSALSNSSEAVSTKDSPAPPERVDLAQAGSEPEEDLLLDRGLLPWVAQHAHQEQQRALSEIHELMSENRWEDIVALFHPVEESSGDSRSGRGKRLGQPYAFRASTVLEAAWEE